MPVQYYSKEKSYPLPPSKVWELLGDTEHLNRSLGLPSVTYGAPAPGDSGFFRPAVGRFPGGLKLAWKEHPFDWIRDRFYGVLRLFDKGPLERFYGGIEVSPEGEGSRVKVYAELSPRGLLGKVMAPLVGNKGCADTLRYLDKHLALARKGDEDALPRKKKGRTSHKALEAFAQRLPEQAGLTRLKRLLIRGTDEEVVRMRPGVLARKWKEDRDALLKLFLGATREGLLTLSWEMICPNCRVSKASYSTLKELDKKFHCDTCGVDYEAELDRSVEVKFSVHPSVRKADWETYCIGGPFHAPHILLQRNLLPGAEASLEWEFGSEPLRFRAVGSNGVVKLVANPKAAKEAVVVHKGGKWSAETLELPEGKAVIRVVNEGQGPLVALLERTEQDPDAVTAAEVALNPEFRSLFGSEVLSPGRDVGVRRLALMFTDLKGSTALYEQVGEASAFGRVSRHFDFMEKRIAAAGGTVVKTIGDAVMAAYLDPAKALKAALEIQKDLPGFNKREGFNPDMTLKIGLYEGPAIAVEANGRTDFFGRTVNIAARVQGQALGGDIVIPANWAQAPATAKVLSAYPHKAEPFQASLKGLEGEFPLLRVRLL